MKIPILSASSVKNSFQKSIKYLFVKFILKIFTLLFNKTLDPDVFERILRITLNVLDVHANDVEW